MTPVLSRIPEILVKHEEDVRRDWLKEMSANARRSDLMADSELEQQSRELLRLIATAAHTGDLTNYESVNWRNIEAFIQSISASRAKLGFSPSDTATYIMSLKQPLFTRLRAELGKDPNLLFEELWTVTTVLDRIALLSTDAFIHSREQIIRRQQEDMLELS